MFELSDTTKNTVSLYKQAKKTYSAAFYAEQTAQKIAVCNLINDVLGKEWTAKEFNAIEWQCDYNIDFMPSLPTLRRYGWVEYRVDTFVPATSKYEGAYGFTCHRYVYHTI